MIHNENSRVKIPALVHLTRLGYAYLSCKEHGKDVHPHTNIFRSLFRQGLERVNNRPFSEDEANAIIDELSIKLANDDLGKAFYAQLLHGINGVRFWSCSSNCR